MSLCCTFYKRIADDKIAPFATPHFAKERVLENWANSILPTSQNITSQPTVGACGGLQAIDTSKRVHKQRDSSPRPSSRNAVMCNEKEWSGAYVHGISSLAS